MNVQLPDRSHSKIRGFALDHPRSGETPAIGETQISGWALGSEQPVHEILLRSAGVEMARFGVDQPRPDIEKLHPDLAWSGSSGFRASLPVHRLPVLFKVEMIALLDNDTRFVLGTVEGSWTPPVSGRQALAPLMLTTLGRSGSTWITRLLGQHPEVTSFEPFRYEPRAASYWLGVYGGLASPESVDQVLRSELYGPDWWAGARRSQVSVPTSGSMEGWLALQHAQTMLPIALDRIDQFYREAAMREGKDLDAVRYYMEKYTSNCWVQPFLTSLHSEAREIMLVRDPRDMVCSMLAYNRRTGVQGFGRSLVESDEAFARWWQHGVRQMLEELRARAETATLLRYEDLIRKPNRTLTRLFDALGLEASDATVEGVLGRAAALRPKAQERHRTSSNVAASVGRWTTDLSPTVREAAEESFADLLEDLGYASAPEAA